MNNLVVQTWWPPSFCFDTANFAHLKIFHISRDYHGRDITNFIFRPNAQKKRALRLLNTRFSVLFY